MAEPVVTMTARVAVDKNESFREVVKAISDVQSEVDGKAIVYRLTADESSLEKTLKEIQQRSDLQVGVDLVIKSDAKIIQDQINNMFGSGKLDAEINVEANSDSIKNTAKDIAEEVDKINNDSKIEIDADTSKTKEQLKDLNKEQDKTQKESNESTKASREQGKAAKDASEKIKEEAKAVKDLADAQGRFKRQKGEVGDAKYSYVERKGFAQDDNVTVDHGEITHDLTTKYELLESEIKRVTLQIVDAKAKMDEMSKQGINTENAQENLLALGKVLHGLNKELDDYYESPKHKAGAGNRNALTEDLKNAIQFRQNEISQRSASKFNDNLNLDKDYQLAILADYEKRLKELGLLSEETQKKLSILMDTLSSADSTGMQRYNKELRNFKQEMEPAIQAAEKLQKETSAARAKEYENIFYDGSGKLRGVEFAPDTEALNASNSLYDRMVANLEEIYDLKEKNLKIDNSTKVGQADAAKNEARIAELGEETVRIRRELSEAEAIQISRENELLSLHQKRNEVLREMQSRQQLQSIDDMTAQVGKWEKQIAALKESGKYTQEFEKKLDAAQNAIKEFGNAGDDIEKVNEAFKNLNDSMTEINSNKGLAEFKKAQESSIAKLNLQIQEFMDKNSRMGTEFQKRFNDLKLNWDAGASLQEVQKLVAEFAKLKSEVTAAGKLGASFFDTIRQRAIGVNAQLIAQFLSWQDMLRYTRQAIDVVNDLDYALVDLKKTTTMTTSELNDFYYGANDIAKQMGVTTEEIINQASAWSRLGYSSREAATEMAALSSQFAQISPGMDIDLATDGLVSTMKAFHVDVANVERDVMDVINKTGNTMATSNEEIVEMLKRSSAAMAAANNTINETIALESAAVQITRNAETTGTAFRTISMRIRGYNEETEEYIGGIEELTGKVADLTKTASTPGGISLFTDETKTTYKSTYQILKDISEIYNELSDANQAALLETLAGKRGGQVLAGILADFSEVERAMENMEKAAGSADAEMSIVEESIDYKLNNLQQTWVGIIQQLIDNGMLGQLIDALTAISEILGSIITTLGPVPSILAGLGVRELLLNLDRIPGALKAIQGGLGAGDILSSLFGADVDEMLERSANAADSAFSSNLENVGKIFADVTENASEMSDVVEDAFDSNSLSGIGRIFTDATEAVSETVDTVSEMSDSTQTIIETVQNLEGVFGEVTETAEGTAEAVETIGETAGGAGVSGATKLASAFKALGPILTNPITIMAALAVATYALYKWVDEANDRQRDKIKDLQKEFNSLESELDSTNNELSNVEKQIEEIQSKGTISLVEQQELERLRTQAELLKIARMEQEELLKLKAQELTAENSKLFNSVYGDINADTIDNPEERIQGYDQMVGDQVKFSYGEQLSSALESAAKGDYNDSPNELLSIFQQIQEAREGALKTIEEYGSKVTKLNEEELAAFEGAKEVIADTDQYMSGLGIQIGKVKTELLNMKDSASRAGTDEGNALVEQINGALKLVYQYSDTGKEWNAMQIGSIFDNPELEKSRQELEAMAAAGELNESTIKQYPKLREEISNLDLILGDGETAFSLFKNELLASAEAAKQVDEELSNALDSAKSWESERDAALEKLGLAKEGRDGIEYDDSWTRYLETIKQLNPELANNEEAVEKCALANMQFSAAVDDLSKNFATYKEALQDGSALTPEYSNAINALADDLTYLTGVNFSISEAADFLGDVDNLNLLEQALNGSDDALQKLQDRAAEGVKIKIDKTEIDKIPALFDKYLKSLNEGGTVDLSMRPVIDAQYLRDVGWVINAADTYATVFTKTFTNEAGNIAVNFTPILVDENGNYKDVLSEESLDAYVREYFATGEDPWNLKIGATFEGDDAKAEAEAFAQYIHSLHELKIELGLDTDLFYNNFNNLASWISENQVMGEIDVAAMLDANPFLTELGRIMGESSEVAQKVMALFDSLGWKVNWKTEKVLVGFPEAEPTGWTPDGKNRIYRYKLNEQTIYVPTDFHYEPSGGRRSQTPTSKYTPRSMSPSQKSGAASNIDKANGGGGGGGSDSSAEEKEDDYKETIDFFERFIKVLDQQIDLLDAHLQDVVGSFAKNMILDAEEDAIKKKMAGYSSAIEMYSAKASEALSKIPGEVAEKLQNGAVAIDEFIGESNKDVVDAINDYQGWADKIADCKQQVVELREALRQLELQKFQNIAQDFQELFDVRNTQIGLIDKAISLFETDRDKVVGRGFYDVQIEQTEKQLTDLYAKHTALSEQMTKAIAAGVNVAGDEWFEMVNAIEEVNGAILESQTRVEQYKNAIIQLYVEAFDRWNTRFTNQIGIRQKAISSLEKQIALYEAAGNLPGRSLYDAQISQFEKELNDLTAERTELTTRLNEAMKNGVKVGTDEWYKMVTAIHDVDSAIQDTQISIKNTEKAIKQLYITAFEQEASRFDNMQDVTQTGIDMMEKQIELLRADNYLPDSGIYEKQLSEYESQLPTLQAKRASLQEKLNEAVANGVKEGTDEWYKMAAAIRDVEADIQDVELAIKNTNKSITALAVESFERDASRYSNIIDVRQKSIDAMQQQIALIEASGSVPGRALYDRQIEQYQYTLKDLEAERLKLTDDLNDAMKKGVKEGTDEWYNMVNAINGVDSAILNTKTTIEQTKKAIQTLYTTLFTNEAKRYSNENTPKEYAKAAIDREIARLKAAGELVGRLFYEAQIDQTVRTIDTLKAERDALVKRMSDATKNGVEVGSDQWMQMVGELNKVDSAIQDCEKSIEEFDNAILAIHTETFERVQTRFSNLSSEISNIIDMFDGEDVATTDNKWTKEGLTQLGLQAQQYEIAKKQVKSYNDEIAELNKQYQNGKYSATEYAERLAKLKSEQWNSIKASEAAKKAILELNKARVEKVIEGIEDETKAYEKLINAQKESLQAERDLHDYEKSVAESSKSIQDIERQLAALEGDESLSARAKRMQLEEELSEARQDLAELEYQHSIETQQDALDQQSEAYSEAQDARIEQLRATLEEENLIMAESFAAVKENAAIISEELRLLMQQLGIDMSTAITSPWQAGEAAIGTYSELFSVQSSAFMDRLALIEAHELGLQTNADAASISISNLFDNSATALLDDIESANQKFREQEEISMRASDSIANNFSNNAQGLIDGIQTSTRAFNEQEEAANRAANKIAENFAKESSSLLAELEKAKIALQEEQKEADEGSRKIADLFGQTSDDLVTQIENAYNAMRDLEEKSGDAATAIAGAFDKRANDLIDSINAARSSAENLQRASDAVAGSLSSSIEGSYSGSSAVNALDSIKDAADGVKDSADAAAGALSNMIEKMAEASNASPTRYRVTNSNGNVVYDGTSKAAAQAQVQWYGGGEIFEYAKGSPSIPKNQLAWTQEDGPEAIVDPATGGILTPLSKGSAVLPTDQTKNIWEWSRFNPEEFASKLAQSINTSGKEQIQTNTMQVGSLVTFNGPVNDTAEMIQIAAQQASTKIKQSFKQLSNGLNG